MIEQTQPADGEQSSRLHTVRIAWLLTVGAVILGLMSYVRLNQIGPRVFWATDVCPEPNVSCGVLPLVVPAAAVLAMGLLVGGQRGITLLERRWYDA